VYWSQSSTNPALADFLDQVAGNVYTQLAVPAVVTYYWVRSVNVYGRFDGPWSNMATITPDNLALAQPVKVTAPTQMFKRNAAEVWDIDTILLTATKNGVTGSVVWSVASGTYSGSLTDSGGTLTVNRTAMTTETVTFKATVTDTGIPYSDIMTIAKVVDGAPGERGDTGAAGSITGYGAHYSMSSASWSDTLANRVIYNMLTGESSSAPLATTEHLMVGDTVTISNGSSFADTKSWNGTAWAAIGMVINGNLIVTGTVSAAKITAGAISTGFLANANITIGDTTFVGVITSPLHVSKVTARANQTLISAKNDKDSSVAIWGSSVWANGNAVSGTWHSSGAEATAGRWQLIGVLGSHLFGAAVAGNVYNSAGDFGGWFRYFSSASDSGSPVLLAEVKLASGAGGITRSIIASGKMQLAGTGSSIILNADEGTAGQVLTSGGAGVTPTWTTPSSGSVTYGGVQTAFAGVTGSVLNLTTTFRSTGTNAPTSGSGMEVAHFSGQGFLISATRTTGGAVSAYLPLQIQGSTIDLSVTPTFPTAATATNSTAGATTAYVIARIANDAPTKTGSGASGTWGIAISGSAASVNGYRTYGGAATTDGSGNVTVTFPAGYTSSSSYGCSATSTSGINVVITGATATTMTFQTQNSTTNAAVASQAIRWVSSGT
jgi:hypothetical protein